jgi:hypothetical protein
MSKTRLIEAVKRLDLEETRQILDSKPALLQVITPNGRNLLPVACTVSCTALRVSESRAVKMAGMLLDRGLDIDEPGLSGRDPCPPLFFAVAFGRIPAVVKYLLGRGADIRAVPGGGLFAAGWWNDTANLKLLLDAGAPIDVVVGVTPFLAAWCWKRVEAAKYLAKRGA